MRKTRSIKNEIEQLYKILKIIKEGNGQILQRSVWKQVWWSISYSLFKNIIDELEEYGVIDISKPGFRKHLILTKKGLEFYNNIINIWSMINNETPETEK